MVLEKGWYTCPTKYNGTEIYHIIEYISDSTFEQSDGGITWQMYKAHLYPSNKNVMLFIENSEWNLYEKISPNKLEELKAQYL